MATELTKYLTTAPREFGSSGLSPLEKVVQEELTALTRVIAKKMVAEHPELGAEIERLCREVVTQALRQDNVLLQKVVSAVAEAVGQYAREQYRAQPTAKE